MKFYKLNVNLFKYLRETLRGLSLHFQDEIVPMSKIFLLILLLCVSCSSFKGRRPADTGESRNNLINQAREIKDVVAQRDLNADTCEEMLTRINENYRDISDSKVFLEQMKLEGEQILNENFEARLALHSMLDVFPKVCRIKLKEVFANMRATEDFVGVHFYNDPQIAAENIKFEDQPIPVYEPEAYHPYHVGVGIDPKSKFEFKNGDIMITKGVSFVSSTISEIAVPHSLFSHIVFVHVDEKTKKVTTMESYVGKGVGLYPIDLALKNENSRILILRSRDAVLAARAANYMYERISKLKGDKKIIPYDYELDFSDNSKLSCEEVAYDAFKTVSRGAFILPEIESEVTMTDASFLKRVGIKNGMMMVPADMETDSRFDIVLDWTDYRLMRDSWKKDAVLGEMLRWITEYKYTIHENLTSVAARAIWSTRYIPGVWGMLSSLSGIPKDFAKDVPPLTIATMASLKTIGGVLLPELKSYDQEYFQKNKTWPSSSQLRKTLDDFRKTEPKKLMKVFREKK